MSKIIGWVHVKDNIVLDEKGNIVATCTSHKVAEFIADCINADISRTHDEEAKADWMKGERCNTHRSVLTDKHSMIENKLPSQPSTRSIAGSVVGQVAGTRMMILRRLG